MPLHALWDTNSFYLWATAAAGDFTSLPHAAVAEAFGALCVLPAGTFVPTPPVGAADAPSGGTTSDDDDDHALAHTSFIDLLTAEPSGLAEVDLADDAEPHAVAPAHAVVPAADGDPVELALRLPAGETVVPALRYDALHAIDALRRLPDDLAGGCSDTLRFFHALARLVVRSIGRQQIYPSIKRHDGAYAAHWQVLVGTTDAVDALERFAAALPAAARALPRLEGVHPLRLVETFLTDTTDALVRRAVSGDDFFDRVHERPASPDVRWLSALLGVRKRVDGGPDELLRLSDDVHMWLAPITNTGHTTGFRLGFELIEPGGEGDLWPVRLLLVTGDEDEEALPAEELWRLEANNMTSLGRSVAERQAKFMAELARAAEVFPSVERLLGESKPTGMDVTPVEAYGLLRNWARQLEDVGFVVRLPSWARDEDSDLSLRMSLDPYDDDDESLDAPPGDGARNGQPFTAGGRVGLESIVKFDWRVAVGGMQLTAAEFEAIVARQSPLVKIRDRWVPIDLEAAKKASDAMKQHEGGRLTLGEAFRYAYGLAGEAGVPVSGLSGADWIGRLLDQAPDATIGELAQPTGFLGELRPYQLRGLQWLEYLDRLGLGACLADDMGLGKTIQFIALLLEERVKRPETGPTLLFAPASVIGNWKRELQRFAPTLKVMAHHGPDRHKADAFHDAANAHDVVLTGYALAHRDLADLKRVMWYRVALDEAQKVKNPSSAASVAIRSIAASRRVALTGTPIENHLSELWAIMETLNPGLLGSPTQFRERFVIPVEKMNDRKRGNLLRELIRPFVLRRTKQDSEVAANLPDKMEMRVYCSLTPEQAAMYERVTAEMLVSVENASGIRRRGLILAGLTRLKQICDHPALLTADDKRIETRSGKCERLLDMLEEVQQEGEAALVFTQYREMGHLLEKAIANRLKAPTLFLHGGVPVKMRDEMVEQFQTKGTDKRIFILSLRAGGLGLNLTAANHVFHFDRWWNPAVEAQATDRAHRIGQVKIVQVHKFVSIGTVEERIDKLLTEKLSLAESIVTSGDQWLTNLSTDDLRKYLALSDEAVEES